MSYILDALRRADSERDRGAVPGLHTQPLPVIDGELEVERRPRTGLWIVAAAFVVLLAAVAWLLMERSASQSLAAAEAAAATAPVAPVQVAASQSAVNTQVAQQAAAPAASEPVSGAVASVTPAAPPSPPAPTAEAPQRKAPTALREAAPKRAPATQPKRAPAAPPPPETDPPPRIYALNELPEEIRRALPATPVSGSVYSRSPANRMVVIGGQVFHEGDKLADQLVLEQIRQKSAVLRFKDFRYLITFQ